MFRRIIDLFRRQPVLRRPLPPMTAAQRLQFRYVAVHMDRAARPGALS